MPQTGTGSDELSAWTGRVSKMAAGTQAEMERERCGFWVEADPRRWILELGGATMRCGALRLRHTTAPWVVRYGGAERCNLLAQWTAAMDTHQAHAPLEGKNKTRWAETDRVTAWKRGQDKRTEDSELS